MAHPIHILYSAVKNSTILIVIEVLIFNKNSSNRYKVLECTSLDSNSHEK